jgi:lipid-binding SYLF domain-containing protein
MKPFVFAAAALVVSAATAHASTGPTEADRLSAAARVVQEIRGNIPQQYWDRARCVAVIPDLKKAALVVGGEYGKGVLSCRAGDTWSAPVFLQLAKGSWGFQAGAEQVDVVMLIMNESGVQKLLRNKVNLGADASVAAGPIGAQGQVGTDAALTAEILSYSRAKGLFAGIDLSGGVLRPDEDANKSAYGADATPRTILASREISAPPAAQPFLAALSSASAAATTSAAPPTTTAGSTPPATSTTTTPRSTTGSDDLRDLRASVVQMEQMLDRLVADGAPATATTGTTGTDERSTITVDRAKLIQLRQQLDALAAALDRRR